MSVEEDKNESSKGVKINTALWGNLNQTVITGDDAGVIRVWDVESGKALQSSVEHKKPIQSLQFNKDHTLFITASTDMTAKLFDAKTLKCLKTFSSDRPLNAASISPGVQNIHHVILGGGQEARNVTTTGRAAGHFEVDFHHTVYQTYLGQVKGHFGPVNCLSFSPDGRSFVSGSEDGYVRLHHFSNDYFNKTNY
jgi:translation initiation factor 3 subunit I